MPGLTSKDAGIPVVDLESPDVNQALLDAAIEYGFIFVKHTETLPLRPNDVDEMFNLSKEFFAAPDNIKGECPITNNRGFGPLQREALDPGAGKKGDFKECFNFGEFKDSKAQQPLSGPLKSHEAQIADFYEKCHLTCDMILKSLSRGLKIPKSDGGENWLSNRHDRSRPSASVLRLLHYPVLPTSAMQGAGDDIRAGAHSDYGSITLLFRLPGQPGLEVMTPSGTWASVPTNPEPNSELLPILVNIGDLLSYWTNGLLKSTVHRVIFPAPGESQEDRYSIAYFCQPEDEAKLVEIPSDIVRSHRLNGRIAMSKFDNVMTARDHLNSRLAATYGLTL